MAAHKILLYVFISIIWTLICIDESFGQEYNSKSLKSPTYFRENNPNIFYTRIDSFKAYYTHALHQFQVNNNKDSEYLSLVYLSDLNRIARNKDSCLKYLKLASSIYYNFNTNNNELNYEVQRILHFSNFFVGNYESSIEPAKSALNLLKREKGDTNPQKLLLYDQLSTSYRMVQIYDSALHYIKQSEHVLKNIETPDTTYLIKNAYNKNYILHNRGFSEQALKELIYATQLINNKSPIYEGILIYKLIGDIYHKSQQFDKAVRYYEQVLDNYKTANYPEYPYFSYIYGSMATSLNRLEQTQEALKYLKKSIRIESKNNASSLIYSYQALAVVYLGLDSLQLSDMYYKKSIELLEKHKESITPSHQIDFLRLYGRFKLFQLKDQSGMEILREAIQRYQSIFGERYHQISQSYNLIANSKIQHDNNPDSALFYYQKALITNDLEFSETSIEQSPTVKNSISKILYFKTIQNKSNALLLKAKQEISEKRKIYFYKLSQSSLIETARAIDHIRNSYTSMDSKLKINEESEEVYANLISSSFSLYHLTNDKSHLKRAYEFVEKSKLSTLNGMLNEEGAKISGNVPDAILAQEKELNIKKSRLNGEIYKAKQQNKSTDELIKELFDVDQSIDIITNELENNYDRYYELKYQNRFLKLDSLQQLISKNQAVLEYYLSDTILIKFIITKDQFKVISVPIDNKLMERIEWYKSFFNNNVFTRFDNSRFNQYKENAYHLYQLCLGQTETLIQDKELIIIPDKILLQIPFETFLTKSNKESNNYRELDYLVKSHPISYAYSTEWLFDQNKTTTAKKNLLSIVPSYDETIDYEDLVLQENLRPKRERLSPIPAAKKEVENINHSIKSTILRAHNATEAKFKLLAKDYSILHFAMHTIIDNQNPMFSKLVFTPSDSVSNNQEDNLLNTYEIYNLELNAQLVTLSSCKSGFGQLKKGEGVMSMARGFMFAGCPSLVLTLWSVDDLASADLMSFFYKHLADGFSKSVALQMAKNEFIQNADPILTHPHFWASHVLIGDTEELELMQRQHTYFWLTAILIVLCLLIIFRKKII